jgi:phage terminase small subunit
MKGDKLTYKQLAFCREYVKNGYNGTQAAIKAGYSEKCAEIIAFENLRKPNIKQRIDHHIKHKEELCNISIALILLKEKEIAFDPKTDPSERQRAIQALIDMLGYKSPIQSEINIHSDQSEVAQLFPFGK